MPNILKAKCGDKEITIKIQRPSFESVKRGYEKISIFNTDDYHARKQMLYDNLYKLAINQGYSDEEAQKLADTESLWIVSIEIAETRYKQVGCKVRALFNSDKRAYVNTCSLRVSYALNYSTHPINTMEKQIKNRGYNGADKHTYYLGVFDIIELLKLNWKHLSWDKSTYSQVKDKIRRGCSEDFYKGMTSKMENIHFFEELQSIQRKGIIAMNGTDDLRHTTLWNGSDFLDTYLELSQNYLTEPEYTVRDLYFWDLL